MFIQSRFDCCAAPIKIFGDLHGQFGDLMRLFEEYGTPSTAGDITYIDYLFLGAIRVELHLDSRRPRAFGPQCHKDNEFWRQGACVLLFVMRVWRLICQAHGLERR